MMYCVGCARAIGFTGKLYLYDPFDEHLLYITYICCNSYEDNHAIGYYDI